MQLRVLFTKTMTREEIETEKQKLEEKFAKLRKIAIKLGEEMDETVDKYHQLEAMLNELDNG